MKRFLLLVFVFVVIIAAAGCGKNKEVVNTDIPIDSSVSTGSQNTGTQESEVDGITVAESTGDNTGNNEDDIISEPEKNTQLLQSKNVDLDDDGIKEEVEALQLTIEGTGENDTGELEGILKITDDSQTTRISFIKKQAGLTGVMTSFEFADLDGDGSSDIFLIIPESGAAFSLNYFYAYSYKAGKSYSFTTDSSLSDFANGFTFEYSGDGKLNIKNDVLNFTASLDVSDALGMETDEESNKAYENSWVEPTPVEIGENSRISLVKTKDGINEIKVPLPVFGRATVDMIGEIDLFYTMDKNFKPVLRGFELLDFGKEGHTTAGKWNQ